MITTTLINQNNYNNTIKWSNLFLIVSAVYFGVWTTSNVLESDILTIIWGIGFILAIIITAIWVAKRGSKSTSGELFLGDDTIVIDDKVKGIKETFYIHELHQMTMTHIDHIPGDGSCSASLRYMLGLMQYPTLCFSDQHGWTHTYNFTIDSYYRLHQIQNWERRHAGPRVRQAIFNTHD